MAGRRSTAQDVADLREAAAMLDDTARLALTNLTGASDPAGRRRVAELASTHAARIDAEADRLAQAGHHDGHPVRGVDGADPGGTGPGDNGTPCEPGRSDP